MAMAPQIKIKKGLDDSATSQPTVEELQSELDRLQHSSKQALERSWEEVERLHQENQKLAERCAFLEERLHEYRKKYGDDQDCNYEGHKRDIDTSGWGLQESGTLKPQNESINGPSSRKGERRSTLSAAFGAGKVFARRMSIGQSTKDNPAPSRAEIETETTNSLYFQQRLRGRDEAISQLEQTIETQSQTINILQQDYDALMEKQKHNSNNEYEIQRLNIRIEDLTKKDIASKEKVHSLKQDLERKNRKISKYSSILKARNDLISMLHKELSTKPDVNGRKEVQEEDDSSDNEVAWDISMKNLAPSGE